MNTEKIMEDIQSVQDNIREIKSTWGNTIMTLDNIKSGLKADVQKKVDEAYQRGLEDAWEAVRKIALMDTETSENVTGYFGLFRIMENLTPMQAIEKLKAYEDKHYDRIEVGDEVIAPCGKAVVTLIETDDLVHYLYSGGDYGCIEPQKLKKTGKHYDIASILEAMRK
jgi:hypothetical protein